MSETWFTSDHHFGHANILTFEPVARPFNSVNEMNEALIARWNAVVCKHDRVYHLGDFAFGRHNIGMAAYLNGQKRLVMGNHDRYTTADYLKYFLSLHGAIYWNECVLTHMPVHRDQLKHRAKLNLHGHLHSHKVLLPGNLIGKGAGTNMDPIDYKYMNVSVEQNNLTPINADIILQRLKDLCSGETKMANSLNSA